MISKSTTKPSRLPNNPEKTPSTAPLNGKRLARRETILKFQPIFRRKAVETCFTGYDKELESILPICDFFQMNCRIAKETV